MRAYAHICAHMRIYTNRQTQTRTHTHTHLSLSLTLSRSMCVPICVMYCMVERGNDIVCRCKLIMFQGCQETMKEMTVWVRVRGCMSACVLMYAGVCGHAFFRTIQNMGKHCLSATISRNPFLPLDSSKMLKVIGQMSKSVLVLGSTNLEGTIDMCGTLCVTRSHLHGIASFSGVCKSIPL